MSFIFSEKLARIRTEKGFNQTQISEKFGTLPSTVSNWENGNSMPSVETMIKIAEYFGVSMDYLCREEEELAQKVLIDVTDLTAEQRYLIQELVDQLKKTE